MVVSIFLRTRAGFPAATWKAGMSFCEIRRHNGGKSRVWVKYLGHHAPSTNRTPSPDGYPRQDNDIASQPTVVTDVDRLAQLRTIGTVPDCWVEWVRAGVEAAIGSHECPGANDDRTSVDKGRVVVQHCAFAEDDVEAVVGVNGPKDPWLLGEYLVVRVPGGLARWKRARVVSYTVNVSGGLRDLTGSMAVIGFKLIWTQVKS